MTSRITTDHFTQALAPREFTQHPPALLPPTQTAQLQPLSLCQSFSGWAITTHLPLGKASLRDTATQLSLSFKKNCFLPPYKEVAEIFFFFLCLFRFYLLIKFFKIPGIREDILFFMPAVTRTWT